MRAKSLRNINVSETVYSGAGQDGELISRPSIIDEEFVEDIKILVKCDQDKKESLILISMLFILICYGFNFLFSLFALQETNYNIVTKICPESLLWYYLLASATILNFVYYICFKGFNMIDNKEFINYLYTLLFILNSFFGGWGYFVVNNTCVIANLQNTKLWKQSYYNNYTQISIAFLSVFTPIYIFYTKKQKIKKSSQVKSSKNENIVIEINKN